MSERERVRLPLVDAATAPPAWSTLDGDGAWHRFDVDGAPFVLVADGSRIYAVAPNLAELLDQHAGPADLLGALGVPAMRAGLERAPRSMGLRSLSLAVAQKCNLGCGYCYAEGGDFGEAPRNMPRETAIAAVEHLLYAVPPGERAHLSFLGGEPFANRDVLFAATEHARGTHRPYPCGAGAGYFGVSAEGDLYPCHRMVQDVSVGMGDLVHGVDAGAQEAWLRDRHVHRQEPCSTCWARYLCGGGCHHEVLRRGRPACDFIRGWLDYCLKAYVRLSSRRPDFFGG